jgi:hypothetical protein
MRWVVCDAAKVMMRHDMLMPECSFCRDFIVFEVCRGGVNPDLDR